MKGVSSKIPIMQSLAFDVHTRALCEETIGAINSARDAYYGTIARHK